MVCFEWKRHTEINILFSFSWIIVPFSMIFQTMTRNFIQFLRRKVIRQLFATLRQHFGFKLGKKPHILHLILNYRWQISYSMLQMHSKRIFEWIRFPLSSIESFLFLALEEKNYIFSFKVSPLLMKGPNSILTIHTVAMPSPNYPRSSNFRGAKKAFRNG